MSLLNNELKEPRSHLRFSYSKPCAIFTTFTTKADSDTHEADDGSTTSFLPHQASLVSPGPGPWDAKMLRLHKDTSRPKTPGSAEAVMAAAILPQSQPEAEVVRTLCVTHKPRKGTPGGGKQGSYSNHWLGKEHRKRAGRESVPWLGAQVLWLTLVRWGTRSDRNTGPIGLTGRAGSIRQGLHRGADGLVYRGEFRGPAATAAGARARRRGGGAQVGLAAGPRPCNSP